MLTTSNLHVVLAVLQPPGLSTVLILVQGNQLRLKKKKKEKMFITQSFNHGKFNQHLIKPLEPKIWPNGWNAKVSLTIT